MAGRDVEGDKRDNKGEDEQMAARYGESGAMSREDGGSGDNQRSCRSCH